MRALAPNAPVGPPGPVHSPPPRRSPRAWFRARLDRDPRRWVLALAALDGLAAFSFWLQGRRDLLDRGYGVLLMLAFAIIMPAVGVLAMLWQGRLLLWTGKLLGGRAAPREIHAAFGWSQLPFVVVALPLSIELPLRAAAAEMIPPPRWIAAALAGLEDASEATVFVGTLAALAATFLYVKFLAEAQRFSAWRSLANHVLGGLLGVALLAAGIGAAYGLRERAASPGLVALALAVTVGAPLAIERLAALRRRRAAGAGRA